VGGVEDLVTFKPTVSLRQRWVHQAEGGGGNKNVERRIQGKLSKRMEKNLGSEEWAEKIRKSDSFQIEKKALNNNIGE